MVTNMYSLIKIFVKYQWSASYNPSRRRRAAQEAIKAHQEARGQNF